MDSIELSGLSIADPSPLQPRQDNASGEASWLSPKLREKLNKLVKWRIDPSLIELTEGTSEFEGGHATVSRALLTPVLATGPDLNEPNNAEGGPSSSHGSAQKKTVAVKK